MSDKLLNIEIGGLTFTIIVDSPLEITPISTLYDAFRISEPGQWHVRVTYNPTLHDGLPPHVKYEGAITSFGTMSHMGHVDLSKEWAEVSTPSQQRIHSALVRVLSFILMQTLPRRFEGLLVHGAGIVLEEEGHLFFGASGRGKSTVARLARGIGQVLTDENVLIRTSTGGFHLESTPFWGLSTPPEDIQGIGRVEVPLKAIYALEHSSTFELELLSKGRATMALLTSEKVATERNESAAAWLEMVSNIVEQVPVYRLGFRPTHELWHFLAERGCIHPLSLPDS